MQSWYHLVTDMCDEILTQNAQMLYGIIHSLSWKEF